MRLRSQELWKGCPTQNNSAICMETWHILSPRHLHKPWGAFAAHFTGIFQRMMKFWFPIPRKLRVSLCSFGLDLTRGLVLSPPTPDLSSFRVLGQLELPAHGIWELGWTKPSRQNPGEGGAANSLQLSRCPAPPFSELVEFLSFKAEAGELLNVDMFYSWQWDLKPLKHTGSMTALWTWNERSQRRTPNVLGSNYQITC